MMIRYFDLEGRVNKIPSFEEVKKAILSFDAGINLLRWNCLIKEDDYLEAVTTGHSIMGRGYYILEGLHNKQEL